jgi:hypothetical protein
MNCRVCNQPIPEERVEALKEIGLPYDTCVSHSQVTKPVCLMSYDHKTAGALVRVPQDSESVRLAKRAFNRSR